MNCCGNKEDSATSHENGQAEGGSKRPFPRWMMMACCIVPIVLVVLFLLGRGGGAASGFPLLIALLCPLSHLILMPLLMKMGKKH